MLGGFLVPRIIRLRLGSLGCFLRGLCSLRSFLGRLRGFIGGVGCWVLGDLRSLKCLLRECCGFVRSFGGFLCLRYGFPGLLGRLLIRSLLFAGSLRCLLRGCLSLLCLGRRLVCFLCGLRGLIGNSLGGLRGFFGVGGVGELLGGFCGFACFLRCILSGLSGLVGERLCPVVLGSVGLLLGVLGCLMSGFGGLLCFLRCFCGGLGGALWRGLRVFGLRGELIGDGGFLLSGLVELLLGVGQRILRDVAQLFLHLGVLRQLGFEFLQELLGVLLRHLGEHLSVGELLVELCLNPQFFLRLAQFGACLREVFAFLHRVVVFGNLLESILKFLLLLGRTLKVGLLLCIGILRGILKRLLRLWRRIFEHRQRIICIPHRFTLLLFQYVLLVRFCTDQVLQRLNLRIELLLLSELRRESRCEFRDARRELLHPLPRFIHVGAE